MRTLLILALLVSSSIGLAQTIEKVDSKKVKRVHVNEKVFDIDAVADSCDANNDSIEALQTQADYIEAKIDQIKAAKDKCKADVATVKEFLKNGGDVNWQDIDILR